MIEKELKFVHLEEGLKAYNDGNNIKLLAIYLASALEVMESTSNPDRLKARLEIASELSEEEAGEILGFFIQRLEGFAKRFNKPFGASEKQMGETLSLIASLGKLEKS